MRIGQLSTVYVPAAAFVFMTFGCASAQSPSVTGSGSSEYSLYAGLIKSKGYTVGSLLGRSGFHKFNNAGSGDTTWSHIGWNIPRVSALAVDPGDRSVIFLACGNGVLRSLDGGSTWKIVTDWRVTESQGIAIDPARTTDVYVATAYGIWRSSDHGETWLEANAGFAKKYTQNVAVDRTAPGRVLAATDGGIYISDRAASWERVSEDIPILDLHQSELDPNLWIAATRGHGVLLSRDGGSSWSEVRSRRVRGKTTHAAVLDPTNVDRMAAAGWKTGVLLSSDGGASWKSLTKGLPSRDFYELVFDPGNPGRLYAATVEEGIFYTDNDGKSWEPAGMYGTLFFDLQFIAGGSN